MKTIKLITLGIVLLFGIQTYAQMKVNVNVGSTPVWGPPVTTQEYYFIPEINSYYDIRESKFIYLNNGTWIRAKQLPARYKTYKLNRSNVIILNDYRGRSPYAHYKNHKIKYGKGNSGYIKRGNGNNGNGVGSGKGGNVKGGNVKVGNAKGGNGKGNQKGNGKK